MCKKKRKITDETDIKVKFIMFKMEVCIIKLHKNNYLHGEGGNR